MWNRFVISTDYKYVYDLLNERISVLFTWI